VSISYYRNLLRCVLFVFFFTITSWSALSQIQWVDGSTRYAYNDGIELSASDSVCFTARCPVTLFMENKFSIPNSFVFDVTAPYTVVSYEVESRFINQSSLYNELVVSCGSNCTNFTSYNRTVSSVFQIQKNISTPLMRSSSFSQQLGAYETKISSFFVQNTIGSSWKYDISFLDPIITSIHYQVSSLADFALDVNPTGSRYGNSSSGLIPGDFDAPVSMDDSNTYMFLPLNNLTRGDDYWYSGVNCTNLSGVYASHAATFVSAESDMISCDDAGVFDTDVFSFFTMMYITSMSATDNPLAKLDLGAVDRYSWQLSMSSGLLRLYVLDADQNQIGNGLGSSPPTGEWFSLGVTYDGSASSTGIRVYINGEDVGDSIDETGGFASMQTTSYPLYLGARANSGIPSQECDCSLANFSYFNGVELNTTDMLALHNLRGFSPFFVHKNETRNFTSQTFSTDIPYDKAYCMAYYDTNTSVNMSFTLNGEYFPMSSCDNATILTFTNATSFSYVLNLSYNASSSSSIDFFALYFTNDTEPADPPSEESSPGSSTGGGGGGSAIDLDDESPHVCDPPLVWLRNLYADALHHKLYRTPWCRPKINLTFFHVTNVENVHTARDAWDEFHAVHSVGNFIRAFWLSVFSFLQSAPATIAPS
jgi:hypothetical protein